MPWPISDRIGIIMPKSAIDGIVMIIAAMYSTMSATRLFCVIAMPIGTPVRIASVTATPTIEMCCSVRWPIAGRLFRMKLSVSNRSSTCAGTPRDSTRSPAPAMLVAAPPGQRGSAMLPDDSRRLQSQHERLLEAVRRIFERGREHAAGHRRRLPTDLHPLDDRDVLAVDRVPAIDAVLPGGREA